MAFAIALIPFQISCAVGNISLAGAKNPYAFPRDSIVYA